MSRAGRALCLVAAASLAMSACTAAPAEEQASEEGQPVAFAQAEAPPGPDAAATEPARHAEPLAPPPALALPQRAVFEPAWSPFATVGGITLLHPSPRVERVAFHESNHDGAREMEEISTIVAPVVLESRGRGTGARTAADIVVDPDGEIRSPVSGVVKRAGTYVLYCDYSDDFVVIAPDEQPSWEVKILHIDGVMVRSGQRVTAGQTVLAPRPTRLAFESQVDRLTVLEPWPHVHLEVVDPSIPNTPKPGRKC